MILGTGTERPVILAVFFFDGYIIDACNPEFHLPILCELPVFVAVRTEPVVCIVVPLVCEPDCNPVLVKCPDFLDEPVVELFCPLPFQECDNGIASGETLGPVTPHTVRGVGKGNLFRVTGVPCIFSHANFLYRSL